MESSDLIELTRVLRYEVIQDAPHNGTHTHDGTQAMKPTWWKPRNETQWNAQNGTHLSVLEFWLITAGNNGRVVIGEIKEFVHGVRRRLQTCMKQRIYINFTSYIALFLWWYWFSHFSVLPQLFHIHRQFDHYSSFQIMVQVLELGH